MHGGATIRQVEDESESSEGEADPEFEFEELEPELCPVCGEELVLRRSRSGPMMVCNTYPKCKFARHA